MQPLAAVEFPGTTKRQKLNRNWLTVCAMELCNYMQNAIATFCKNGLQLFAKRACKKHIVPAIMQMYIVIMMAIVVHLLKYI